MNEEKSPSFQKARDEAVRALIVRGGLTPDQVSALKLKEVHLATSRLVVELDEFDPSPAAGERPFRLKLDETMQRALIAWLVVRPDGPNDHLFPGPGLAGLDREIISQVISAERAAESRPAKDSVGATPPPSAEREEAVEAPPEPPSRSARRVKEEDRSPAPPAAERHAQPETASLDEIESLRKRLAETYDAWAPALPFPPAEPTAMPTRKAEIPSAPRVEPTARPPRETEVPSAPPAQVEPPVGVTGPEVPLDEEKWETIGAGVPEPVLTPSPGAVGDELEGLWEPGEKRIALNLSYRAVAIAGLALAIGIVCCVGLAVTGGRMLSTGRLPGLLAGATPSATPTPAEMTPSVTSRPSPTPTVIPTSSPTLTPSATFAAPPVPTDTPAPPPPPGPTPTPIIVVVTATPTPEPPPTATPVPTNTPVGSGRSEPTPTSAPAPKYPAPVLLEPEDGSVVPGVIALLKWEPAGPLADEEWYAVRLIFLQQGTPAYRGDRVKESEWRVPDRFYYQADGPALEYRWYVFVERENPDGSTTPLSPESETFVFRWE